MRPHRLRVTAFGAFAGERSRSRSTTSRACSCCTARPARARRRCSTRSRSPSTAGCPGSAAAPGGCAPTTRAPAYRDRGGTRGDDRRPPAAHHPQAGTGQAEEVGRRGHHQNQASIRLAEPTPTGDWESSRPGSARPTPRSQNLMGMSAEQFFQVVLLPQGEFAQVPARQGEGKGSPAAEALRHRPLQPGRGLASRPSPRHRQGGNRRRRPVALLVAQLAQAADVVVPESGSALDNSVLAVPLAALAGQPVAAGMQETAHALGAAPGTDAATSSAWQAIWAAGLAPAASAEQDAAAALVAARRADLRLHLARWPARSSSPPSGSS